MTRRQMRGLASCCAIFFAAAVFGSVNSGSATPIRAGFAAPRPSDAAQGVCRERANSQRVVVVVFAGPKTTGRGGNLPPRSGPGVQVADSMRHRFGRICPEYFPVAAQDIERNLEVADFPTDTALSPTEIRLLGGLMGAHIVIFGEVSLDGRAWTIKPRIMDPTSERITQPLPNGTHASRVLFAVDEIMSAIKPALAVMPTYAKCRNATKEDRQEEAIALGRQVLAQYPQSTMARICIASALDRLKAPPDSILALTDAVLAMNPTDYYALRFGERAERARKNFARANKLLVELLALDPLDEELELEVLNTFAQQEDFTQALKFVEQFKAANPLKPGVANIEATICLATKDFECAARAYGEVERMLPAGDTTTLNAQFYERLVTAHKELRQFKEAAEAAGRGSVKFPSNENLIGMLAQFLRETGDTTGSIAASRKAIALNPANIIMHMQVAAAFGPGKPDSMIAALEQATRYATTQSDTALIHENALAAGQGIFDVAIAAINDTLRRSDADYEKLHVVIRFTEFADRVSPQDRPKFYLAASNYNLGIRSLNAAFALQASDPLKTCELAKDGYDRSIRAVELIQLGGGRVAPAYAAGIITNVEQNRQHMNELKTKFCKLPSFPRSANDGSRELQQ